MAPKRKSTNDAFEDRFFTLLEGTIEGIDKKVDGVASDVKTANRRLGKLENAVFPPPQTTKQLPAWYRDPAIIKLLTFIVAGMVLVLIIIASLRGIKLPGIFG